MHRSVLAAAILSYKIRESYSACLLTIAHNSSGTTGALCPTSALNTCIFGLSLQKPAVTLLCPLVPRLLCTPRY
ncbi:hypothetical protein SBA1_460096 [Candidatus Sulfotelmatobacter kueseliae]|uniref:Uncharacterized protein n=1 Tax=Candidatus Sulfotelmatobacter kueseliae TaxID=2042962 RepID=A0A2U3KSI2_9BACT|nr:hypothetical protein SBA1_460096 [Candidatus Sulfotelmatobacter kueseliae]